ncbi:MAG: cell division protein FtsL [Candidatus Sumerlaeia bacterium]
MVAKLTNCISFSPSIALIRPRRFMALVSLLLLLSLMGLGQVYLRFLTRDMQIETHKLQQTREKLQNRQKILVSELEQLKCYDAIKELAATELGLQECLPEQSRRAMISGDALARWSNAYALIAELRNPQTEAPQRASLIAELGDKVLSFSSVSMALDDLEE